MTLKIPSKVMKGRKTPVPANKDVFTGIQKKHLAFLCGFVCLAMAIASIQTGFVGEGNFIYFPSCTCLPALAAIHDSRNTTKANIIEGTLEAGIVLLVRMSWSAPQIVQLDTSGINIMANRLRQMNRHVTHWKVP